MFFMLVQVILILSGNLSFLNWLTILPAIFCFDDVFLKWLFPSQAVQEVRRLQERDEEGEKYPVGKRNTRGWEGLPDY